MSEPYNGITNPSRKLNRDRLMMLPRSAAAHAAHAALDPIQARSPEEMVMGASLLFATICKRCNLDPQEMHKTALKVLRSQAGHRLDNDSLQSLQDFAGIRIMGEREVSIS